MDGGSQWPRHSMWYLVAMVLSVWALVEDREAADRSLDSLEKVLQTASSRLPDKVARTASGTLGWIFLTAQKANMDSACRQAVQVSKLQRGDRKKNESRVICTLEQEMSGLDEPSA